MCNDGAVEAANALTDALAHCQKERDELLRVCAAIRDTAHDYEDRLNTAEAKVDAVEELRNKWNSVVEEHPGLGLGTIRQAERNQLEQDVIDLDKALATIGSSLRQRVEAVLAEWERGLTGKWTPYQKAGVAADAYLALKKALKGEG